jgi:cytochrome c biogenesis protein CcmG/thiol:disulfide interchange protein DsbE
MSRTARGSCALVVVLLLATCAGSTRRPGRADAASAGSRPASATAAVGAACPTGPGTPIAGLATTVLPCLTGTGRGVTVSAVHGRPEVINVWASWCRPCRTEAALLESAHRRAGDRVLFLGVDTRDDPTRALRFLADARVSYPQVSDPAALFALRQGAAGLPYTVVVDASGRIVFRQVGALTAEALHDGLASAGVILDGPG